jgi:hypothetical protein
MFVVWLGVALLSVSWLFGLGYYHGVNGTMWGITVSLGTLCFLMLPTQMLGRKPPTLVLLLTLPALLVAPWPYRAAVLLLAAGLLLRGCEKMGLAPGPRAQKAGGNGLSRVPVPIFSQPLRVLPILGHALQRVSTAAVVAGCLLLAQSLAINFYAAATARSHELPAPVPGLLGTVAQLWGIDAAVHGKTVAMHSMREVHLLGATWELFLDPVTFCFSIAAVVLIFWIARAATPAERQKSVLAKSLLAIAVTLAIWLPVRAGLLMALYLHDVLRTEYEANLAAMRLFWNSWLHLALLVGPVLLCWRFLPQAAGASGEGDAPAADPERRGRAVRFAASLSVGIGVALVAIGVFWDPVGTRQQGRVIVEEHNPDVEKIWEKTFKPYDTEWYGQSSGYNYYCIYDYCSRFYATSRLTEPLNDGVLRPCDVLIIKVPTRPFSQPEIRSIRRFVEQGGGLLLIGEHTNVFKTSDYLNPIARTFGFEFRNDCLFGIDSVFEQRYDPPLVPHPIVQHMPPLDFATSCSIDPGTSSGRAVIRDTGLKNLMADYHADNYYPQPEDRAEMRYGSFAQLWATRYGKGRVVAFTDSTIFSNFSAFEPGKPELMLGMIEWLNHRSVVANPRPWLMGTGILILLAGLVISLASKSEGLLLLACGLLGWSIAVAGVQWVHRVTLPLPQAQRPFVQVVIDRTLCDGPLAKNGFIEGSEEGFGIFERWLLRLGYFTARRQGPTVFDADLVIYFHPHRAASEPLRGQMLKYVAGGGKILVIDSPQNENSTSDDFLAAFGITVDRSAPVSGQLETAAGWPAVPVADAALVRGGAPFAWIEDQPVGTTVRHANGQVTVISFGSRFNDANMGLTGDVVPDANLKQVFDLQFALMRAIVESESLDAGSER